MKKRTLILLVGAIAIATAAGFITRSSWMGGSSNAQGPQRPRMVSVELAKAERKSMPVDVDAIGMVTPISSVALKSRLEIGVTIPIASTSTGMDLRSALASSTETIRGRCGP